LTERRLPGSLSEYTMRAAAPDDAARAAACVHAAYRHYIDRNGLVPGPMRQDYAEVIRDFQVTVVEHGDDVVAVLALAVTGDGFLLDNVAVDPAYQGIGLGRLLLEYAESEAVRQGFDSIYLYAQEAMTENIALYERIGYVEYARRIEIGLPRVYLRKQLG
jgi:ribosomal protein S18 acetylase RimI-like enzyme